MHQYFRAALPLGLACCLIAFTSARGQGVRLLSEKPPEISVKNRGDRVDSQIEGDTATYTITSVSGIGSATLAPSCGWAKKVLLRLKLRGLESLSISDGRRELRISVLSHGGHAVRQSLKDAAGETPVEPGNPYAAQVRSVHASGAPSEGLPPDGGCFEVQLPAVLLADQPPSLRMDWIDFYR